MDPVVDSSKAEAIAEVGRDRLGAPRYVRRMGSITFLPLAVERGLVAFVSPPAAYQGNATPTIMRRPPR